MIRLDLFVVLFVLSTSFIIGNVKALDSESIIGGENTYPGQYKYHIALYYNEDYICGGGIIGDQFVITAAHCVIAEDVNNFEFVYPLTVVAGTNDLMTSNNNEVIVNVAKIYLPKRYSSTAKIGDIAVLKLTTPLSMYSNQNLQILQLPSSFQSSYANEIVTITGFGYNKIWGTKPEDGSTDYQLRSAQTKVTMEDKDLIFAGIIQRGNQISGICDGDSGGPLVYNGNTLIGIASYNLPGCTERELPAVYTRVAYYLDFIYNVMADQIDSTMAVYPPLRNM